MSNITKYLEKRLLQQSVGVTTTGWVSTTYIGLFSVSPTVEYLGSNSTNIGTELTNTSANGYGTTRQSIAWNLAVDNNDTTNSSKINNSTNPSWTAGAVWPTVTTVGIFDGSGSGANLLWFGPLSSPVTLSATDNFTIPINSLTLTLA
jgi:hypothetical protein